MYTIKTINTININNIVLKPAWLGKIDLSKGCYNSNPNTKNISKNINMDMMMKEQNILKRLQFL